jgi:hypothetical protein
MRLSIPAALVSIALGLSWPFPSGAQAQDLGEWRALTPKEEKDRIGKTPRSEADPSMIEADFDGDGKKDKALIAIRISDGARGLIAVMNGHIHPINPDGVEPSDGLRFAKPDRWDTVCGHAYREFHDCTDYPSHVTLKNPGILWISVGRTVLYFWDRKTKRFDGVLMVD